ncbi:DUF2970 domain-containing protein [Aliiglaciecola sp. 3_MG-2023]|uniref:DUF2970 domain-containing protein n=1 Tax=Aliiglaciecola sp. 3_MG-2023 TaxID=3062644 RepID=UPI0026E353C3|nr:DUF2970 domain-containing protein [Aliiglaciecola sp. 3_MG-2023]MDO6692056.1 DUF2970 domain-containing protein [Aliiglaciecola sp. 3_MG-2023]
MSESKSNNSLWGVFKSVAASVFGVQSHQNYEHDFQQKSFVPFLLVGIVFVIALILGLVAVVNIALS